MKRPSADAIRRERDLGELLKDGRPRSEFELRCIDRQRADLLHGHERGLKWDEQSASDAVNFFRMLRHWKGPFANRPFDLQPWQEHCVIAPIYGWKNADGNRRFRFGYVEIPRKNGKTTLTAGVALHGLIADGEQGAEVYCAATKRDQALLLFNDVKNVCGPKLKPHVKIMKNAVIYPGRNGTLQAVSSDYNTLDGLNVSLGIVDELHAHKNRHLWDVMLTAMGARLQPYLMAITTAGYDRSTICWELRDEIYKVCYGHKENDAFFGFVTTIDDADDWRDPATWWKANPNLRVSISETFLQESCQTAIDSPDAENNFRRKHLNQWTEQAVRWLPMHIWDECKGTSDLPELYGKPCWAGLDLASTKDVNSLVLVFPLSGGRVRVLPYYWVPEDAKNQRAQNDRTQVMNWAGRGLIATTPGDTTDYETIELKIMELSKQFDIRKLAFDDWGPATRSMQALVKMGFPFERLVEFPQRLSHFARPTKKFEELLIARKLEHGGCPVLRWMAGNVTVYRDTNDYIRPDKGKSADKIDGIVASIMGLGAWLAEPEDEQNIYNDRPLFVI